MAQYTETAFATDSFLQDAFTGVITRAASLTALSSYSFSSKNGGEANPCKLLYFQFPERAQAYNKKRLVSQKRFVYISAKSELSPAPGAGDLPAGSYPYCEFRSWTFFNVYGQVENQELLFSNIPTGAYLNFTNTTPFGVGAGGGVTNGLKSGISGPISCSITVQSHTGTNKPYIERTYEDVPPLVKNPYPQSGFINEHVPVTFGWAVTYTGSVATPPVQASAKFRWRPKGQTEYTEHIINGAQNTYTVPAGTFVTEQIEWQVVLTSDDGIEGVPSAWYTLSTVDSLSTPEALSPKSALCDGAEAITFRWLHNIATGTPQSAYELQYSDDSGATWEMLAVKTISAATQHTEPPDSLPAGTLLWRVKTYNSDNVPGEWSAPVAIIVRAAPPSPSIGMVTESPRPSVTWQSLGQQAYQVRAGGFDSGAIFGTAKAYKIPAYLPDGEVAVGVRVQNSFGLWSPWAEATVNISNAGVAGITLAATQDNGSVYLSWQGTHAAYYIERDGVAVGKTTEQRYTDYLASGAHDYVVRGVTGDAYNLSNAMSVSATCKDSIIAEIGAFDWIPLVSREQYFGVDVSRVRQVAYQHYAGRRLPVAEIAEYEDESYAFDASFFTRADVKKVLAMIGKTVVLKTPNDERYIGVLESTPHSTDWAATEFKFTIRAIDYVEAVSYD